MKTFYGLQTLALLPPGDPSHTSSKCAHCISTLLLLQIHTGLLLSFYQRSCPTRDHTKDVHRQLLQHWEIWFHCIKHQQEETNRERLSSSTMRHDSHITWWGCAQNSQVGNNPTCRFYTDSDWIKNKFTPSTLLWSNWIWFGHFNGNPVFTWCDVHVVGVWSDNLQSMWSHLLCENMLPTLHWSVTFDGCFLTACAPNKAALLHVPELAVESVTAATALVKYRTTT